MLVYILIFLYFLIIKSKKTNKYFFILLILMALRYDVGWDYLTYYRLAARKEFVEIPLFLEKKELFKYMELFNMEDVWGYYRFEFLNRVIYKISWFFKWTPQIVIIIYGLITLVFIKKGIDRNIKEKDLSKNIYIVFYSLPLFYFNFLSLLRQGVVVGLIFYSYTFIRKRQLLKFILIIVIASLFHSTALVMLPIYLLYNIKITKKIYLVMFVVGIFFDKIFTRIVIKYNIPVISKYKTYVINTIGEGGAKLFYIILMIGVIILFLLFIDKKFYKKNNFLILMTLSGVFIYCSLISLGHLGPRMSMYFLIYILYLVPEIEKSFKRIGINRYIITIFMLVVLILNLYVDSNNSIKSQFIPYKAIFLIKLR